jgi:CheY-like chemotaxis protein
VIKRVLIVDDEPVLIALLKEIFARFQHGHTYEITPRIPSATPGTCSCGSPSI